MIDVDTMRYLKMTAMDELKAIAAGKKPAALGFWDVNLLHAWGMAVQELHPVPGRYYKYAIARKEENLKRLVHAYYLPISDYSDIAVGYALGYSTNAVRNYVNNRRYKDLKQPGYVVHVYLKVKATIEKIGVWKTFQALIGFSLFDKIVWNVLRKEGIVK